MFRFDTFQLIHHQFSDLPFDFEVIFTDVLGGDGGDSGDGFVVVLYLAVEYLEGYVYSISDTRQKREFVNMVFDSNLYYEQGIYRTPTMLGFLSHNHLKMKEKGLLIYEKKEGVLDEDPLSGERGIRTILVTL